MNRHGLYCALIAFSVTAGCGQPSGDAESTGPATHVAATEPMPTPNNESPDNVVKSYWALHDWVLNNECRLQWGGVRSDVIDELGQYVDSIGAGDYLASTHKEIEQWKDPCGFYKDPSRYQRDIIEVQPESETRASVLAKIQNITPIPEGVTLDESDQAKRDYGRDLKYVVEKTSDGWRLTQAWHRDLDFMQLLLQKEKVPGDWKKVWESPAEQENKKPSSMDFYWVGQD